MAVPLYVGRTTGPEPMPWQDEWSIHDVLITYRDDPATQQTEFDKILAKHPGRKKAKPGMYHKLGMGISKEVEAIEAKLQAGEPLTPEEQEKADAARKYGWLL